jgi:hypothetical protein
VLFHDESHGEALIEALARHGDGLPARVLPLRVNEVSSLDLAVFAGAFAWGAAAVRLLAPAKRGHGVDGVLRNIDYAEAVLAGLGLAGPAPRAALLETDDPFSLGEALAALPRMALGFAPARFEALGSPREMAQQGFRAFRFAGKGALRSGAGGTIGLHALPCLHQRLPDQRLHRQSGSAGIALFGRFLRAMRTVRRDLPGEGDYP